MRLVWLAVVLALSLLLAPLAAVAQPPGRTYRIGWLAYGWTEGAERTSPEFVQELKKHIPYFVFEFRGHRDAERLPGLARELIKIVYGYEEATKHRRPPATTPPLPAR
jgi:hypothetical protein